MEELYQNKAHQGRQLKAHSPVNESQYSSKQESVLQEISKNYKNNQNFSNFRYTYMHQKLKVPVDKVSLQKRKEKFNILKLDTKTKTNCIKISLNGLKKAFNKQGISNRQNLSNQKKQEKICPNIQQRGFRKDIKNLSDLCILSQGRREALLKYQQKLRSTNIRKKYNSTLPLHATSRLFSQKQKYNKKNTQQRQNHQYQRKHEAGYQKRITRVKTHENFMRQMFSRYDCFKNDKKDITNVVGRIRTSLNKKVSLFDYFDQQ